MPIGRVLVLLAAAASAGCAAQTSHLSVDITDAGKGCRGRAFRTQLDSVECFNGVERPIISRDVPELTPYYDRFYSAEYAAALDYDRRMAPIRAKAVADLQKIMEENRAKLSEIRPLLPSNEDDRRNLIDQANQTAAAKCRKGGVFSSASQVVNLSCERDAKIEFAQSRIPAVADVLRRYYSPILVAAADYDRAVLPAMDSAAADFKEAITPAKSQLMAKAQELLGADAAETAREREAAANLLAGLAQAALTYEQVRYCSNHPC